MILAHSCPSLPKPYTTLFYPKLTSSTPPHPIYLITYHPFTTQFIPCKTIPTTPNQPYFIPTLLMVRCISYPFVDRHIPFCTWSYTVPDLGISCTFLIQIASPYIFLLTISQNYQLIRFDTRMLQESLVDTHTNSPELDLFASDSVAMRCYVLSRNDLVAHFAIQLAER